jgi:hypothetical protein
MRLTKPLVPEVVEVIGRVWARQTPEIVASMKEGETIYSYAVRLLADSVLSHVWVDGDTVYAVGGWILTDRHTATSWLFHTDDGLGHASDIIRVISRAMQNMRVAGVRRFEAVTIENEATERWYRALDMHREKVLENWGSHGEDMALYVNERN